MTELPRIAYAGDRDVAVAVLKTITESGIEPSALLLPKTATHADRIEECCPRCKTIYRGSEFKKQEALEQLQRLDLDYLICIHFPYIIPPAVLAIPRLGVLNLHPAYLPFNRGWHTPSWTILQGTPAGATLHFMDEGLDTGDIVHQKQLPVACGDTADSLYTRLKELEIEVFREAWPSLLARAPQRMAQTAPGTFHRRQDLFEQHVQKIELDEEYKAEELLDRLRALTTSEIKEACYFEKGGKRYRVRLLLQEETPQEAEKHKPPAAP